MTPRLAARGGQGGAGSRAQPSSPKRPAVTEPVGGKAQERIHVQLLPRFRAPPGGACFLRRKAEPSPVPAGPPRPPPCPLAGASAPPALTHRAPAPRPPRTRRAGAGAAGSTSALPAAAHAAGSTPGGPHSATSASSAPTALSTTAGSSPETRVCSFSLALIIREHTLQLPYQLPFTVYHSPHWNIAP